MVRAHFARAFRFGPPCWDNVIAEALCVTLQSSLTARQGDVGLSDNWAGSLHYLKYQHVDVRLHGQGQDAVFFAKFTMRESKNNRYDLHPSPPGTDRLDGVHHNLMASCL